MNFAARLKVRKGTLLMLVYDIPYFPACGVFPPLHILNQVFFTRWRRRRNESWRIVETIYAGLQLGDSVGGMQMLQTLACVWHGNPVTSKSSGVNPFMLRNVS
jgi:hypothetical protein